MILSSPNGFESILSNPKLRVLGINSSITLGTPVRVTVKPGRIVIEAETELSLDEMLAAFDPQKHGGELMADSPIGVEAFS